MSDIAVGIVEGCYIYCRNPENRAVGILLVDPVGRLEGDLGLADATEALESGALAVVLARARRDPFQELV